MSRATAAARRPPRPGGGAAAVRGLPAPRAGRDAPRDIVPHSRPSLGGDEERAALRVLRSGRLAPGAEAARLEGLVSRLTGGADAVALQSGTLALTLALRALGVKPGGVVAVPSYGCAALAHAVRALGAEPLACDVDPELLALDPDDVRRRAPRALEAIVVVHPFGSPVPLEPYRALGPPLIEDCAQSPGARLAGRPVGAEGDAAILSFGPTKLLTCGGPGGALAAGDPRPVRLARDLAAHDEKDDDRPRVNGLMGDLHAAVAAAQIGRLGEIVSRRASVAARYDTALSGLGFVRPRLAPDAQPVPWRYLVRGPRPAAEVIDALRSRGVLARHPVWRPLHQTIPGSASCPGAETAHARWISLPLSPALGAEEVARVLEALRACRS